MRNFRLFIAMAVLVLLTGCGAKKSVTATENGTAIEEVKFEQAFRYFLKNGETCENPKITTQEEFSKKFGMATVMGKNGQPTIVDFDKQFVIAVTYPETNNEVRMSPISLQRNAKGDLTFIYEALKVRELKYTTKPCLIIIVDKKDNTGEVFLKETVLM